MAKTLRPHPDFASVTTTPSEIVFGNSNCRYIAVLLAGWDNVALTDSSGYVSIYDIYGKKLVRLTPKNAAAIAQLSALGD